MSASKQDLMARSLAEIRRLKAENEALRQGQAEPIAIIGLACRFPGANSAAQFWEMLRDGRSGVTEVPPERWSLDDYYDEDGEVAGKSDSKHGAFLPDVDKFDAAFFGISPKEARSLDPQQRLLLEMAWEAMESAGVAHEQLTAREVGVFVGMSGLDYAVRLLAPGNEERIDPYFGTGVAMSPAAGRLSYFLKVTGPSMVIDTACSSSLVALHSACESLRRSECEAAFVGGVSLILSPAMSINFSKSGLLAPDGVCRPFDDAAQGYTRGEGAGMVLLKPLAAAQRDGDRILALVHGSSVNQDGGSSGLTVPSGPSQQRVIRRALAQSRLQPSEIDYVETHGTATPLGDPIEAGALAAVFAEDRVEPLRIGSVKSNLGHLEAAAGIASLCKTVLSLQHGEWVPHLNFRTPSRHIDWDESGLEVVTEHKPWPRRDRPRFAGVSGFGFSGTNAHVVLSEAPAGEPVASESRSGETLLVSARTGAALDANLAQWERWLDESDASWPAIAATSQSGRTAFEHRAAIWAPNTAAAVKSMALWREKQRSRGQVIDEATEDPSALSIAFAFTGQGSQYRGMGRELYATSNVYRAVIDECAAVAEPLLGRDIRELMFEEGEADANDPGEGMIFGGDITPGANDPINETQHTQVVIFATEVALAHWWRSVGVKPKVVLGHSIGEYAAACTAGVFSIADGVRLTVGRGKLMQELSGAGRMLTVFGEREDVEPFLADYSDRVALAAENGPGILLLSGDAASVDELAAKLEAAELRVTPVPISHAFHSPLTEPVLPEFEKLVRNVQLKEPTVPLISNVSGDWAQDEVTHPEYWVRHLRDSVQFCASMNLLHAQRPDFIVEVGPQATLMGLDFCFQATRAEAGSNARWLASLQAGSDAWKVLSESVGRLWAKGANIDWPAVQAGRQIERIDAPTYAFQRRRYWLEAVTNSAPLMEAADVLDEEPEIADASRPEVSAPLVPVRDDRPVETIVDEFVVSTVCEVSGLDPADLQPESNLLEMGLDSLMFVRMGRLLEHRFQVSISAKQFYDELHRVGPLVAHLATAVDETVARSAPAPDSPSVPIAAAIPAAQPRKVSPRPEPATDGKMRANFAGLELEPHPGLSANQERFLVELIERFAHRTGKSRDFTQAARQSVADWKHSLQFKLSLKGVKYPIVAQRSAGAEIEDLDGNTYVDFALGMGVHYLGHQPPYIVRAVKAQADRQMGLGPQSDLVAKVAEQIKTLTGVERVSFTITGTQAVTLARRLARAATGRNKIVQFAGAYHGIDNDVLAVGTEGGAVPLSPGIPQGMVDDVIVLDYNSPEALAEIAARAGELAAVMVEPVQSRRPGLQPHLFLRKLRRLTRELGIPLIFDEMINGFRVLPGGAQAWFGIEADIVTYGKIVGGGLPLAVVAGKAKYLDWIDGGFWQFGDASMPREQTIFTGGTHNRHPLALAAARAALDHMIQQGDALAWAVNRRTTDLVRRLNWFFEQGAVPIRAANFGSQFRLEAPQLPFEMEVLHTLLLEAGIYTWEQRTCCVSTVHTEAQLDALVDAVKQAVSSMREAGFALHSEGGLRRFVPMSSVQCRLYALSQREGGEGPYHLSGLWRVKGQIDFERLQEAFQEVVVRHESLRTAFLEMDGEWVQEIIDEPRFAVERWAQNGEEPAALLQRFIRPFDLTTPPLLRVGWIDDDQADQGGWIMLDAHHLAVDGLSMDTVLREVCAIYEGQVLPRVSRQYRTAQAQLESDTFFGSVAAQETYWQERLAGELPVLNLPLDRPRPPVFDFAGDMQLLELSREETAALKRVAQTHGCSYYIVLMTGFALLLERLSGQSDLIVGVPVGGRGTTENEAVVGMFVNTLALRLTVDQQATVAELVRQTRNDCLAAYEHQDASLSRVLEAIAYPSQPDRNGLFDVMFSYENADQRRLVIDGMEIETVDQFEGSGMFDLNLDVIEEDGVSRVRFHYATSLFEAATIARWREYYATILHSLARAKPDDRAADLSICSDEELALVKSWEREPKPTPGGTLLAAWQEQVTKNPDHTALRHAGHSWTYAEVNIMADRLVARLSVEDGFRRGDVIAIARELDPVFVVAALAAWKVGMAYLPIDPHGPAERNSGMLADAEAKLVIAADAAAWVKTCPVWTVTAEELAEGEAVAFADQAATPDDLAYVIFTSGSTGKPKGVEVNHDAITRSIRWRIDFYRFDAQTVTLQMPAAVFDASVLDVFSTLAAGATLVLPEVGERKNLVELAGIIEREKVTNTLLTPSLYAALLDINPTCAARLKLCCVAGESLSLSLAQRHFERCPETRLINEYGPTENSVVSTALEVQPTATKITIGRPVADTTVMILDREGRRCPPGVVGELWLGGPGLARGYRGNAALTAERFRTSPAAASERFYRSGDRGCWIDGEIRYAGRVDAQVKLRGVRIELGEIEDAIRAAGDLEVCLARVEPTGQGGEQLAGYYVAPPLLSESRLRDALWSRLPEAMVPTRLCRLDVMPLTVNGKVDVSRLPRFEDAAADAVSPVDWLTQGKAEKALMDSLRLVMPGTAFSGSANFFSLGGDSIKAIQVLSRLRGFGWAVDMTAVYRAPTLAALAAQLVPLAGSADPFDPHGAIPLSGMQHWWLEGYAKSGSNTFAQYVVWRMAERPNAMAWQMALRDVAQVHPALGLRFLHDGDGAIEQRFEIGAAAIASVELGSRTDPLPTVALELAQQLDVAEGPLGVGGLVSNDAGYALVLVVHHAVVDGVSWRVLGDDLRRAYAARCRSVDAKLAPPTNAYREWHQTLAEHAAHVSADDPELAYWREQTEGDRVSDSPARTVADSAEISVELDSPAGLSLLSTAHEVYRTQADELLLAAFVPVFAAWSQRAVVRLELERHGRTSLPKIDLGGTVGWFTAAFPWQVSLPAEMNRRGRVRTVKEALRKVPHEGVNYRWLRAAGRLPAAEADISFNFLGQWDEESRESGDWQLDLEQSGSVVDPAHPLAQALAVSGFVSDGRMVWRVRFDQERYTESEIRQLLEAFRQELEELAAELHASEQTELTPADFTVSNLDLADWDRLLGKREWAARSIRDVRPVTPMQEGLLFEALLNKGSDAYFQQMRFTLTGVESTEAMEAAWRDVIAAHEICRTVFVSGPQARMLQVVRDDVSVPVAWPRGRDLVAPESITAFAEQDRANGFDLERGPLMRTALFKTGGDEICIVWSHHHLLMDGWCVGLWMQRLLAVYQQRAGGQAPAEIRDPSSVPYYDWLAAQDVAAARSYWRRAFADHATLTSVLPEFPGAHRESPYQLDHYKQRLPAELHAGIVKLAQDHQVTVASILTTAASVMLGRYTNQRDVVVGAVVSGRPAEVAGIDEMMGLFINTIPVRLRWDDATTWRDILRAHETTAREVEPHHHYPLARIQEDHASLKSLFDHLVVYENYPMDDALRDRGALDELSIRDISAYERTNLDLNFIAQPVGDTVELDLNFNSGKYDREQVAQLAGLWQQTLAELLADPDGVIAEGESWTPEDRTWLTATGNATAATYPTESTVADTFDAAVASYGDRSALTFDGKSVTYRELAQQSHALAHALVAAGVGRGDRVGIALPRGIEMVAAFLATAKTGAVYVPLDLNYPPARTQFMVEDAGCKVVVVPAVGDWTLNDTPELVWYSVDLTQPQPFANRAQPDDPLYVIYTSGSTGKPKGCVVTHRNVMRLMCTDAPPFPWGADDCWLVAHSLCFDFSVWELYGALLFGGRAVIAATADVGDASRLATLVESESVSIMSSTPGAFYRFAAEAVKAGDSRRFPSLRYVIFGGDRLECHYLQPWRQCFGLDRIQLVNMYGITETTVHVTAQRLTDRDFEHRRGQSIIGTPLAETEVWVVNASGAILPIGAVGEIWVGGTGLASGYLNRPELTAERFVTHPLRPAERAYRSGDLGRWLSDGTLEYLGRNDHQVQVRGYRVETGEIEARFLEHTAVRAAVVIAEREVDGTDKLVAFLAGAQPVPRADMVAHLEQMLPRYMVPSLMHWVAELPLTPNGKVDRAALMATPQDSLNETPDPEVPRLSGTLAELAVIWTDVLGLEVNDPAADFVALGGHSLKAMQLVSLIEERIGVEFPVAEIFTCAQLDAQARRLDELRSSGEEIDDELLAMLENLPPDELDEHLQD
ncbi:amino acid adenylation domain-containing protein [Opitutaceae bacterium]|nr:amino acid adenylation domain-containing protein [Opitutaceae bacterium]